jgi:hypothetical protein
MGTRSLIAVVHGNNYKAVYCHWDGYLSHNGRILQEHYGPDKSPKANHLVALGNISSLGTEIGEKHPFSQFDTDMPAKEFEEKYGNMTTFYGRDRDEEGQEFITHTSKESLIERANDVWAEYVYVMKDGTWYVMFQGDPEFYLLSEELAKEKDTVEVQ